MYKLSNEIVLGMVAITCICIMQVAAMHYGINGTFRALCLGAIMGIGGWLMPQLKLPAKKE